MASLLLDACQSWLPSASALLLGHGCQHKSTPVERTNSVYFVSRQRVCPCLSHSINLEQLVKDHNIVFGERPATQPSSTGPWSWDIPKIDHLSNQRPVGCWIPMVESGMLVSLYLRGGQCMPKFREGRLCRMNKCSFLVACKLVWRQQQAHQLLSPGMCHNSFRFL